MLIHLARYWWLLALRGALALLFGVLALVWPGVTLATLVLLFGAYAIVDGVAAVGSAVTARLDPAGDRWWLGLQGVVSVIAGVVTFVWPDVTALALLALIAVWSVVTGVLQIVAAVRLRRELTNEWLLALGGAVSILFGLFVLVSPGQGAVAVAWLIGLFAIMFGVILIGLGLRLRGHASGASPRLA